MGWFCAHEGISVDIKYPVIMRESGADGAQVAGIWLALMDCASKAKPRGGIARFNPVHYAEFAKIDVELVRRVFDAMQLPGIEMHNGQRLTTWEDHQLKRTDNTAAERKARHILKKKQGKGTDGNGVPVRAKTTEISRKTNGTDGTGAEEIQRISDASQQASVSHTPLEQLQSTRGEAIRPGDIWARLEAVGMPVGLLARQFAGSKIRTWVAAGITADQLTEAVKRATKAREREQDTRPLNLGYLDAFVGEVIAGKPAKTTGGSGYEHGDQLSRDHATRAR